MENVVERSELEYEILREYVELEMLCLFRIKYVNRNESKKNQIKFIRLQYDLFLDCQEYIRENTRIKFHRWFKVDKSGWKLRKRLQKDLNSIYIEAYEEFKGCTNAAQYMHAVSRIPDDWSPWKLTDLMVSRIEDLLFWLPFNE